ncbi:MAG: 4a-hydroxytetrahydrobiopterin dehydratase [Bryobacterales bacterium]
MAKVAKLPEAEMENKLAKLPGWSISQGKLHREYKFADFVHAFGFMAAAAVQAEARAHHPEWSNVWNRVTVDLTTHDAGGITEKDFELATAMEAIATKLAG